ncbi:hypothetical protein YB2330_005319 [Saitoella coloradoensis]
MGQTQSMEHAQAHKEVVIVNSQVPVRFSNSLVNHLESAKESKTTRSASLEQHIQERVQSELERLREREAEVLERVTAELTQKNIETEKSQDAGLSSVIVESDIEALRKKFQSGPKLKEVDAKAKAAREAVVACFKAHEGRSLDCWSEVEAFKSEVKRLETEFVASNQ